MQVVLFVLKLLVAGTEDTAVPGDPATAAAAAAASAAAAAASASAERKLDRILQVIVA